MTRTTTVGTAYHKIGLKYGDRVFAGRKVGLVIPGSTAIMIDSTLKGNEDKFIYVRFPNGSCQGFKFLEITVMPTLAPNFFGKEVELPKTFRGICPECGAHCMSFMGEWACPIEGCQYYREKEIGVVHGAGNKT